LCVVDVTIFGTGVGRAALWLAGVVCCCSAAKPLPRAPPPTEEVTMGWRRHKKVIDLVKGYRGRAKNCWTVAVNRHEKALQHAYKHRRTRRRESRRNWIVQVSRFTACALG